MQPRADQPLSQLLILTVAVATEVVGDHLVEQLASGRARCSGRYIHCALVTTGLLLLLGRVDPHPGR